MKIWVHLTFVPVHLRKAPVHPVQKVSLEPWCTFNGKNPKRVWKLLNRVLKLRLCVWDVELMTAGGGYLWRSMWILWMNSSVSSRSTSSTASVSELSRLVTHRAVSSPQCNSEKRPLSNSVVFRTLFKLHRYCGIIKNHIIRKINTGIRYEPVYRPALLLVVETQARSECTIPNCTVLYSTDQYRSVETSHCCPKLRLSCFKMFAYIAYP